jgi:hypothetical protein
LQGSHAPAAGPGDDVAAHRGDDIVRVDVHGAVEGLDIAGLDRIVQKQESSIDFKHATLKAL